MAWVDLGADILEEFAEAQQASERPLSNRVRLHSRHRRTMSTAEHARTFRARESVRIAKIRAAAPTWTASVVPTVRVVTCPQCGNHAELRQGCVRITKHICKSESGK